MGGAIGQCPELATFETWRPALTMSVSGGRPVVGDGQSDAIDPKRTSHRSGIMLTCSGRMALLPPIRFSATVTEAV
jgi:hypothetical protein